MFSFGPTDSLSGATVDSAFLHISSANYAPSNIDSIVIWAAYEGSWQDWDDEDSDVSWAYYDTGGLEPWSPRLENMDGTDIGSHIVIGAEDYGSSTNSFNSPIDVSSLVQDHIDNGTKLVFMFYGQGSGVPYRWSVRHTVDPTEGLRPYLEIHAE
jgi:hypothetical protein